MTWSRTLLALLLMLTMAFAPVASTAMAKPCTMTMAMTTDSVADCPCRDSMPDCGTMPQCQTAAGCASQCSATSGVIPTVSGEFTPDHDILMMAAIEHLTSLAIKPPAPPPRT